MSWRKPIAIALGLLMALPLVLVTTGARFWSGDTSSHHSKSISPVLSWAERHQLLSFERPCRKSQDCDPPLACLDLDGGGQSFCVASECLSDQQCQEGFTCRLLHSRGNGPLVRYCIPTGTVPEGTLCVEAPANRQGACLPGLICSGWCGRPCRLDEPSSCPQGAFCEDSLNGPLCLPACTEGTCPSDQQCIHFRNKTSACVTVVGENCQRTSCSDGRKCTFSYSPGQNQVEMECVTPCDQRAPSCAQSHVCFDGACRLPCSTSADCGPDERCTELPVAKLSLCYPRRH